MVSSSFFYQSLVLLLCWGLPLLSTRIQLILCTGIDWQHPYSYGYGQTHYSHGGIASTVDVQPVTHQVPQSPLKLDNTGKGPLTSRREVFRREQHRQGVRDRKPTTSTRFMRKRPIVKKRNEKSYQVQAFCEERGLTPLLGVIW